MKIDIKRFLKNLKQYARDTEYDYTYYLILHELKRMKVVERIGGLNPALMNPVSLFLRDWMPHGWISWSEKKGVRWEINSKLCDELNRLKGEFSVLKELDLQRFEPRQHGEYVRRVFERIYELGFAASPEAKATVTSKILHLLIPKLFVMWDTHIIRLYGYSPDAQGYLEFMTKMREFADQLKPYLGEIDRKAEELRVEASQLYGAEFCLKKSLAKLIDEHNWMEARKSERQLRHIQRE